MKFDRDLMFGLAEYSCGFNFTAIGAWAAPEQTIKTIARNQLLRHLTDCRRQYSLHSFNDYSLTCSLVYCSVEVFHSAVHYPRRTFTYCKLTKVVSVNAQQ